ncbi:hypothetical protein [Streptomyces sp. NRRL B-24720]|uniref:hypothetical protein n=1 Tax=Streptomyces sp. NRRL B-24720 TaxID=1476876 RepID=UPI00068E7541|nr:hypothetical protein [Streptomyces sp. NRRL B-24720]
MYEVYERLADKVPLLAAYDRTDRTLSTSSRRPATLSAAPRAAPSPNWLVPEYGWRSVFVVGGVCSLLTVFAMLALLPESVKFLALKARPRGDERIARILARLQPDLAIEPGTRFIAGDPQLADHGKRFTPAQLYRGHLMGITPLL